MQSATGSAAGGDPGPAPGPGAVAVAVDRLTVRYGRHTAVDSVSFQLRNGVTALLGPNGAGKTTLLRTLATSLAPTSGTVAVHGISLDTPGGLRNARQCIGYLPQHPGFYPNFTTTAFVDHIALLKEITGRAERRRAVSAALDEVGLSKQSGTRLKALSGGMRQRVALACAIVGDPSVVILDEPTVGLDPEQRLRFREMIAALGSRRSVLLSTHLTDDVTALCRTVLVLAQGRMRFSGTPAGLTDQAAGRVWHSSQRAPQALTGWLTADGSFRNLGTPPPGAHLVPPTLEDGYLLLLDDSDGDSDGASATDGTGAPGAVQ